MEEITCKINIGSIAAELEIRPDGSLWLFLPGEFDEPLPDGAISVGNGVFFTAPDSRRLSELLETARYFEGK